MSILEHFINVVQKAQQEEYCHEKLIKSIEKSFDVNNVEAFLNIYLRTLRKFYCGEYANKNPFLARGLEFLAKLAVRITLKCVQPMNVSNPNGTVSQVYDVTTDAFFTNLMKDSLKYSMVEKSEVRFNTCYFVMVLLQNIGNNVEMDYTLCGSILDSLKDLLYDSKVNVRIQALKALVRLQEPRNPECLVLRSFLQLFTDPNVEVRKLVCTVIAPHVQSFAKIIERLLDTDIKVREAAYKKCADTNPRYFKIVDRNLILTSGFTDTNPKVKKILAEQLLPKWLNAYNGNYLEFLKALKLDADENDLAKFEDLCNKVMTVYLKSNSFSDIVKYLPIKKDEKVIPTKQLHLETVLYWSALIKFLRESEDREEYLVEILPELVPFSNYIERIIKEKTSSSMDEWENMEYQVVVFHLFQIASSFDMADEAGRRTFYSIILQLLSNYKFPQKVTNKIICVGFQANRNIETFTTDLCQIISEIREPLIDEIPPEDVLRARKFEMSQMRVKLANLEMAEEEALKNKDFQQADIVHNEYLECQRKLENLKNVYSNKEKVRMPRDDPETLCRSLDILMGVLKIPAIRSMSSALRICKDEFLMPMLSNNAAEVHWRFISCLGLFSIIDKDTAFQHANFLCLPIATYRSVPNYDKTALKISVTCVTDLLRLYGIKILGIEDDTSSVVNQDSTQTSRRKLYSEDMNELRMVDHEEEISIEFIIDIILDMLDDEDEDVRNTAASSITRIIVMDVPMNPELITRLILKWYDPSTERRDRKLQQQIGIIIRCFTDKVKGAREVIGKSVIPIITSLTCASRNSSYMEVDIDNVLRFLAALTNTSDTNSERIHNSLAIKIVELMLNKPHDASSTHFAKLLTYLDVTIDDAEILRNIISSAEIVLDDLRDKAPQKSLQKFVSKLNISMSSIMEKTENDTVQSGISGTTAGQSTLNNTVPGVSQADLSAIKTAEKAASPQKVPKRKLYQADSDSEEDNTDNVKGNSSGSESDESDENEANIENVKKKRNDVSKKTKTYFKTPLKRISEEQNDAEENVTKIKKNGNVVNEETESRGLSVASETSDSSEDEEDNASNIFVKFDYTPLKAGTKKKTSKQPKSSEKNARNKRENKELSPPEDDRNNLKRQGGIKGNKVNRTKVKNSEQGTPEKKLGNKDNNATVKSDVVIKENKVNMSKQPLDNKVGDIDDDSRKSLRSRPTHLIPNVIVKENKVNRTKVKTKKLLKERFKKMVSSPNVTPKDKESEIDDNLLRKSLRSGIVKVISNVVVKSASRSKSKSKPRVSSTSGDEDVVNQTTRTAENNSVRSTPRTIVPPKKLLDYDSYSPHKNASVTPTPKNKTNKKRLAKTSLSPSSERPNRNSKSKSSIPFIQLSPLRKLRNSKRLHESEEETDEIPNKIPKIAEQNIPDEVQNRIERQKRQTHSGKSNTPVKSASKAKKGSGNENSENNSNSSMRSSLNASNCLKGIRSKNEESSENVVVSTKTLRSEKKNNKEINRDSGAISGKKDEKRSESEQKVANEKEQIVLRRSGRGVIESNAKPNRSKVKHSIEEKTPKTVLESKQKETSVTKGIDSAVSPKLSRSEKNQKSKNIGVLKNLNSTLNEIENSRISSNDSSRSLRAKRKNEITISSFNSGININGHLPVHQSTILLPHKSAKSQRSSKRLNGSTSNVRSSRRNLDFSSSEETILKTFLQGDEELQPLEESIEDVTSKSNSSVDSKKENLIINNSTSSSSTVKTRINSRRRVRVKNSSSSNSDSSPRRKILRTNNSRILQNVAH